jgi:hypothetical protein
MRQDKKAAGSNGKQTPMRQNSSYAAPLPLAMNRYSVLSEKPFVAAPVAPVVDEFPALPSANVSTVQKKAIATASWSEMAKKPAVTKEAPLKMGQKKIRYYYDVDRHELTAAEIEARRILDERKKSNPWAFTEDSDTEEDEYDGEEEVIEDDSEW